jgi:hypothetical protein
MPKRAPIKNIFVLTHPFCFHDLSRIDPEIRDRMIGELRRILKKCKEDPGTHVIVNWHPSYDSESFLPSSLLKSPELVKLLKEIRMPKSRLHEIPGKIDDDLVFFHEAENLKKKLGGLEFAEEVTIETYGDYLDKDGCVGKNIEGVTDFVSEKAKIERIWLLGGRWASPLLERVARGERIGRGGYPKYTAEFREAYEYFRNQFGKHADKLVFAWPRKYWPTQTKRRVRKRVP